MVKQKAQKNNTPQPKLKLMDEIEELFQNVNLNEKMENKEKREFVLQNLSFIEPFNGDQCKLALFVNHIDALVTTIVTLTTEDKTLFFNAVQRKLVGPAADILRRENPGDWKALKALLIQEFGESKPISCIILELNNIKFKNSVKVFCDTLNAEICKIKDCIKLSDDLETNKIFYNTEVNRLSVQILKQGLPNHLTALLNANLVLDFKTAIKVLRENGSYNFEYKERNKRNNNFPTSSFNPQNTTNQYCQNNSGASQPFYFPQIPHFFHNPNQPNFVNPPQFNNNWAPQNFPQVPIVSTQQVPRQSGNDSNQSRIRRYGAPVPMEQDSQNFHFLAQGNSQQ